FLPFLDLRANSVNRLWLAMPSRGPSILSRIVLLAALLQSIRALAADGELNSNRTLSLQPPNGFVSLVAKAPDGKLVASGPFESVNGHASVKLIRFYQNGAVDRSFVSPEHSINGDDIRALAVQFDGRVIVGGLFTEFAGSSAMYLVRLTADGLIDPTFHFQAQ